MKSKKYITPTLTVVSFKAEHGYADTGKNTENSFLDIFNLESAEGYNQNAQQNWNDNGSNLFSW